MRCGIVSPRDGGSWGTYLLIPVSHWLRVASGGSSVPRKAFSVVFPVWILP